MQQSTTPLYSGTVETSAPEPGHPRPRERRVARPVIWTVPGIVGTARVSTSFGDLPIQALRANDPLRTVQGPIAKVVRVDVIRLDEDFLAANPDAQPVLIPAGHFGQGRPGRDIHVSPQQKVNVSPGQFRQDFRLARDLLDRPGVMRAPMPMVSYHTFQCATPAAVLVEGLCVAAPS